MTEKRAKAAVHTFHSEMCCLAISSRLPLRFPVLLVAASRWLSHPPRSLSDGKPRRHRSPAPPMETEGERNYARRVYM